MAELIYLYGLIRVEDVRKERLPSLKGFDGRQNVFVMPMEGTAAIVCRLNEDDYAEEILSQKASRDMEWLHEKAFHHHELLNTLQKQYTVIPMKFCTLFKSEQNLRQAIMKNVERLTNTFSLIDGKEEWSVKIYCDDEALKRLVSKNNTQVKAKEEEISRLSAGRQFFERKKIEKLIEDEFEREKANYCEGIHERLKRYADCESVKKTWNKAVTGRSESMCWNGVYLVQNTLVEAFHEEIDRLREESAGGGWKLEATGPWPAYHFAGLT